MAPNLSSWVFNLSKLIQKHQMNIYLHLIKNMMVNEILQSSFLPLSFFPDQKRCWLLILKQDYLQLEEAVIVIVSAGRVDTFKYRWRLWRKKFGFEIRLLWFQGRLQIFFRFLNFNCNQSRNQCKTKSLSSSYNFENKDEAMLSWYWYFRAFDALYCSSSEQWH